MTDQQKVQLLPCPFCGGEAKASRKDGDERVGYNHTITIACDSCGSSLSKGSSHDKGGWCNESAESTELRAVEAWNTRQAALAHASSATVKENLTVGESEAVSDEPSTDREALIYLMRAFDTESWQCPRCGHDEDCATMDSAFFLRDYLRAHPSPSAEDVRDAKRYRLLRDAKDTKGFWIAHGEYGRMSRWNGEPADKAIDQALAAERGEGNG